MRVQLALFGIPVVDLVIDETPAPPPGPPLEADGRGQFEFGFGNRPQELVEGGHSW